MSRTSNPEIVRQIAILAPGFYPRWSEEWKKWNIVRDFPRQVDGVTDYDPVSGKHFIIELTLEDAEGKAIELDNRAIEIIGKALKEKELFYGRDGFSVEKLCDAMDEIERIRILRARKYRDEAIAELFKKLWQMKAQVIFT